MFKKFYDLIPVIKIFGKGKKYTLLGNEKRVADSAFMVKITTHLSSLNCFRKEIISYRMP